MATRFWSFRGALAVFLMFNMRLLEVFDDAVLDAPPQKIELGAGRREPLEIDALGTTKGIKELLTVAIQTRLVSDVNCENLPGWSGIRHVIVLGIIGHEPLEFAEGNAFAVAQNIVKFFAILWYIKEFRDAGQKKF